MLDDESSGFCKTCFEVALTLRFGGVETVSFDEGKKVRPETGLPGVSTRASSGADIDILFVEHGEALESTASDGKTILLVFLPRC